MSPIAIPPVVIEAFHLMWDNFPEPASLVHKSREVMAVNKAHGALGYLKPGMNCSKTGAPGAHKGCLANQALASGEAVYAVVKPAAKEIIAYWLPLDGHPEFFVHFGVGTTIDYKAGGLAGQSGPL